MRYFYAKLGQGNSLAKDYLSGRSPLKKPAIPIFFDVTARSREEFLMGGYAKEQGENFFWCEDHPDDARVVAVHAGCLHVLKPDGRVVFWLCDEPIGYADSGQYVKLLPVEGVVELRLQDVPAVLATINASRYYYSGTFREITDPANVRALESLLDLPVSPVDSPQSLLLCLSSIELETLVAKIFEEAGCFVPAYRGGAMKGIDILARNGSDRHVEVLGIHLPPGGTKSIQLKRSYSATKPPAGCDTLIVAERDAEAILQHITSETVSTRIWLSESLSWLPTKDLAGLGLGT